jgi:Flp pilus assembly protein TadG
VPVIRLARLVARARGEEGGILLIFAMILPGILLLIALSLEIGNWYEHRRHLQLQTDAAALAAGGLFQQCATANAANTLTNMKSVASRFGGDTAYIAANGGNPSLAYNRQVGNGSGAGNVMQFGYQTGAYPPDYTSVADADPCTSAVFDVRATEDSIPHIFKISPLATVHAHSRVEMKAVDELKGLLPIAVPDVRPSFVFASFYNETTGAPVMCGAAACPDEQLTKGSVANNQQTWTANAPLAIPIPAGDVGVRIRLVGGTDPSLTCGELYTECYDAGSANGLVHIRGWDPAKTTQPFVHDAWLLSGDCSPDAYFASRDCNAGIQADINIGNVTSTTNVWATVDGGKTKYPLSPAATGTGVIRWTLNGGTGGIPITGGGPHPIELFFGNGNGTSLGVVQRAFEASANRSGPLQLVQVFEQGVNSFGANSFKGGETHTLGVTIKTMGNLLLSQPNDPAIDLRVKGSQNQTIDCDPNFPNLRDELAQGCSPFFVKNPSLSCPKPNQLWNMLPAPLPCVLTAQGGAIGQISDGLNIRIFGDKKPPKGSCASHPINWIKGTGFDENAHPDDTRALPLIVTPLGTFGGSGQDIVPVIDFGYFYVTGYDGDPCAGSANSDTIPDQSFVAGHFIKFFPLDKLVSGDDKCDLTSITPCVSVLTR